MYGKIGRKAYIYTLQLPLLKKRALFIELKFKKKLISYGKRDQKTCECLDGVQTTKSYNYATISNRGLTIWKRAQLAKWW